MSKEKVKGFAFALASALGYAAVYIIGNLAQQGLSTAQFMPWWFATASALGVLILGRGIKELFVNIKRHPLFFLYFGLSESFATFMFFYLIKILNPALVSFVVNLSPVLVILWAFILLGERLSREEWAGAILSLIGVSVISHASPDVDLLHFLLIVLMTAIFAFNTVLVKHKIKGIPPLHITVFRAMALFSVFFTNSLLNGTCLIPPWRNLLLIVAGAALGPIGATLSLFTALKYLKASVVSLVKNLQPIIVAFAASLLLNRPLTALQIAGGVLTILGVNILFLAENRRRRNG